MTLALLTGRLGRSRVYEERVVGRLEVTAKAPLRIARDGEVSEGPRTLQLRAAPDALVVYRP
jgi:undecaprenyl-diphosphatase